MKIIRARPAHHAVDEAAPLIFSGRVSGLIVDLLKRKRVVVPSCRARAPSIAGFRTVD